MDDSASRRPIRSFFPTQDFLASIVVFLVAVPLCLGIAMAAGLPPVAGLLSGVIGGIVVGTFSGCPLQVSGPAAGVVAIVWEILQTHSVDQFGVIILLAGIIQISFGLLQLGQWFRAMSPAVIQGMLAGVGILIFASQFHVMVSGTPESSGLQNILGIPHALQEGFWPTAGTRESHLSALTGMVTIGTILVWNTFARGRLRVVPAPLVGIFMAMLVAFGLNAPIEFVSIPTQWLSQIHWVQPNDLWLVLSKPVLISAFTVALVASTESLLTAVAVDQMNTGPRTCFDRELYAQGIGNLLAGLVGAFPISGVIVRSAAHVQAGAVSRTAAVFHGLWILVFLVFLPFVLTWIPVPSLAAILVYTGYKLVSPHEIRTLLKFGKSEVFIYAATAIAVVMSNLLEGIMLGFVLAAIKLLLRQSKLSVSVNHNHADKVIRITLSGSANFISLPRLAAALEHVPGKEEVHLILSDLGYIDHACLELIMNWEKQYVASGGTVFIDEYFLIKQFPKLQDTITERNVSAFDQSGISNHESP